MKLDCIRSLIPDTIFFYNMGGILIYEEKWPLGLFPYRPKTFNPGPLISDLTKAYD